MRHPQQAECDMPPRPLTDSRSENVADECPADPPGIDVPASSARRIGTGDARTLAAAIDCDLTVWAGSCPGRGARGVRPAAGSTATGIRTDQIRCPGELHLIAEPWAAAWLRCESAPDHGGPCYARLGRDASALWIHGALVRVLGSDRAWRVDPERLPTSSHHTAQPSPQEAP